MRAALLLLCALLTTSVNGQTNSNPTSARDYFNELKAANEFKTYSDEYVCFYEDDIPSFLVAARGEDVVQLMELNGERHSKELASVKGHLFYKTYYKGVLTGTLDDMPPTKELSSGSSASYQTVGNVKGGKLTATYIVNWATGRIRFTVETGTIGDRGYSIRERYGKCEFIHPDTPVLLDQTIPEQLRANRCFQSKSAEGRERMVRDLKALSPADYGKTMKDLTVINASDRLLGTRKRAGSVPRDPSPASC